MRSVTEKFGVESTMMGEKIAMDIDADSTVHLMGLLTDLYKNRLLAVIREYATNAWDAHIEAGITLPIEITLPTLLAPSLVFRDYGPGLDAEGIRTVYSKYGASTKRETDDQAGMMGLGCKAALTYTNQFTVTSVKDGVRLVVLVARDEDGRGSMQLLDSSGTEDANGTEITVAIRREDHARCQQLAANFFSYWTPGSVMVNGVEPEHFSKHALKISDDLYVVDHGQSMIVMGQVPYPHEINLGTGNYMAKLIAFVPIGAVRPTPSRESLMDTKNTKHATEQIVAKYHAHIAAAIQTEVDNAASPEAAVKAMLAWQKYVPASSSATSKVFTYQGTPIPSDFRLPQQEIVDRWGDKKMVPTRILVTNYRDGYKKSETYDAISIPIREWARTVWVYGYAPAKFTAVHKNKLRAWADTQGITRDNCDRFVLLRETSAPVSPFINPKMAGSWDAVRAVKLTAAHGYLADKLIPGSYKVYTETGYVDEMLGANIRQDKPIFYGQGNEYYFSDHYAALKTFYSEFTLVCLQGNRVAKFERDVPKAIKAYTGITDGYAKWEKTVDRRDLLALQMKRENVLEEYKALNPALIDDPELAELAKISHRDVSFLNKRLRTFGRVVDTSTLTVKLVDLLSERYPLYDYYQANHEHTYLYLNMIYARLDKSPATV